MSREVIGEAGADLPAADLTTTDDATGLLSGTAVTVRPPDPGVPPPGPPPRVLRPGVRRTTLALAVLALAAGLAGYVWADPTRTEGPPVVAAVTGAVGVAGPDGGLRARLQVTVRNPGPGEIRIAGAAAPVRGTRIAYLDPVGATVPEDGTLALALDVLPDCGAAEPPELPAVLVASGAERRRAIHPVGDVAALLGICSSGRTDQRPLLVTAARIVGPALHVDLTSPTGRPTQVLAVRAGGVALTAPALPLTVSGPRTLTLTPPRSCPAPWRENGIPLDLDADVTGPGTTTLPVGGALARWLLATSCREDG